VWQLRERWHATGQDDSAEAEHVRLSSSRWRSALRAVFIALLSAAAGYVGGRAAQGDLPVTITSAMGGGALGFLIIAVPEQALRLMKQGWIVLRMRRRRRRLRRLAARVRVHLQAVVEQEPSPEAFRDLAVAEYLADEQEEAELQLQSALSISPGSGSLINDLGVMLAERGECDRAAEFFAEALGTESAAEATINCALVASLVATPEALEQMLRSAGDHAGAMALNNLGVSYARLGRWDRAEAGFQAASQTNGGLPAAQANLGVVAYRRGQLQEAADRVTEAQRMDPREPAFANYLGVILAQAGQFEQARQYLRRALRVDPASAAVQVNALAVEALAGRWDTAARGLSDLVGEHPDLADAHYNLALCRLAMGEPMAAAASAGSAIANGDTSCEAYTVLAVALWEAGHRAKALHHFQVASGAPGAGASAVSNFGRALMVEGEVERARQLLQKAQHAWPDSTDVALDLATAVLAVRATEYHDALAGGAEGRQEGNRPLSLPGLEAALARQNGLVTEAHVNLGLYLYMQEQYEPAADHFAEALRSGLRARELPYLVGTALGRAGEEQASLTDDGGVLHPAVGRQLLRRAVPYLQRACEAREILADAAHGLGRCLYVLEDFEGALAAFRKGLAVERSEEMHMLAGLAAARQSQEFQVAARGHLLMTEAKRDQLRERSQELLNGAIHHFSQALLRNEVNPVLHGNLGIAYMLRNREHDIESALRHWERMRAIGGGAVERRYAELAQIGSLADAARMGFDDRDIKLRGLSVRRWLAVPPPVPSGLRFLVEPMAVHEPWQIIVDSADLREALSLRDRVTADAALVARLRA
jgi:tetratricopeptide (TPR) repeat protein